MADLTYICCFCNFKSKNLFENAKTWTLGVTNCALILQQCSVEMFALNVQTSIVSEVVKKMK